MKIYIGNLIYGEGDEELRKAFEGFEEVIKCKVILGKSNIQSRGFAFIEMPSSSDNLVVSGKSYGERSFNNRPMRSQPVIRIKEYNSDLKK